MSYNKVHGRTSQFESIDSDTDSSKLDDTQENVAPFRSVSINMDKTPSSKIQSKKTYVENPRAFMNNNDDSVDIVTHTSMNDESGVQNQADQQRNNSDKKVRFSGIADPVRSELPTLPALKVDRVQSAQATQLTAFGSAIKNDNFVNRTKTSSKKLSSLIRAISEEENSDIDSGSDNSVLAPHNFNNNSMDAGSSMGIPTQRRNSNNDNIMQLFDSNSDIESVGEDTDIKTQAGQVTRKTGKGKHKAAMTPAQRRNSNLLNQSDTLRHNPNSITTELEMKQFNTAGKILNGFSLQGGFFVIVSKSKISHNYFLELFKFDEKQRVDSYRFLKSREEYEVCIDVQYGKQQRFACIQVMEIDKMTKVVQDYHVFLLDYKRFAKVQKATTMLQKNSPSEGPKQTQNATRRSSTVSQGQVSRTSEAERVHNSGAVMKNGVIQVPTSRDLYFLGTEGLLKTKMFGVFSAVDEGLNLNLVFQSQMKQKNSEKSGTRITETVQSSFCSTVCQFLAKEAFDSSIKLSDSIKNLEFGLNTSNRQRGKRRLFGTDIDNFKFLQQEICGVFRFRNENLIVVYAQGEQQHIDKHNKSQISQLMLPFQRIVSVKMTCQAIEMPVLVAQGEDGTIIGFLSKKGRKWERSFIFEHQKVRLMNAFGQFLIVRDEQSMKTSLLEIGGAQNHTILTDMEMNKFTNDFTTETRIVASNILSNYCVLLEQFQDKFKWFRYDQQRQFHVMRDNSISQLCDGNIIQLTTKQNVIQIGFYDIDDFQITTYQLKFTIEIKRKQQGCISDFLPRINKGESIAALMISFSNTQNRMGSREMYSGVIFIDLNKRVAQFVDTQSSADRHISRATFEDDFTMLCQDSKGIYRIHLREKAQDGFKVEDSDSDEVNVGGERGARFDFAERGNEHNELTFDYEVVFSTDYLFVNKLNYLKLVGILDGVIWLLQGRTICTFVPHSFEEQERLTKKPEPEANRLNQQTTRDMDDKWPCAEQRVVHEMNMQRIKTLTQMPNPQNSDAEIKKIPMWTASMSPCGEYLYVLYSNFSFCWLYILIHDKSTGTLTMYKPEPFLITMKMAYFATYLSESQLVIHCVNAFAIFNLQCGKIDFKFKSTLPFTGLPTFSDHAVCIPRLKKGVIIELGDYMESCYDLENDGVNFSNINDIFVSFKKIQKPLLDKGYICIDEKMIDYSAQTLYLPISLHNEDYIEYHDDSDPLSLPSKYYETPHLTHLYNNQFTIWEALIRDGILSKIVNINECQLERIIHPVLADNNNSLLHHMARMSASHLQRIFSNSKICNTLQSDKAIFPFFFNFDGKSPLDIAIEAFDLASFQYLLKQLVTVQQDSKSVYLIDSWLLQAIHLGLDLNQLFESEICQQNIEVGIVKFHDQFPDFSINQSRETVKFEGSCTDLRYRKDTYTKYFDKYFQEDQLAGMDHKVFEVQEKCKKGQALNSNEQAVLRKSQMYPITYYVDYYFLHQNTLENHLEFLKALSQTQDMRIFQCGYIQRYINFHWHGKYLQSMFYNFMIFCVIATLIVVYSAMLHIHSESKWATVRMVIYVIDGLLILLYVPYYELKQFNKQRLAYFKSLMNINDLLFVIIYFATGTCNVLFGLDLEIDSRAEATKILCSMLIVTTFIKLMNTMRITHSNYLLRMLMRVFIDVTPYMIFYSTSIIVFILMQVTLGLNIVSDEEHSTEEYISIGAVSYIFYYVRTSLGDFDTAAHVDLPITSQYFLWFYWLLGVFVNTIVFMNFLIAVITDVYEKFTEIKEEEIYLKKADMLCEILEVMGDQDFTPVQFLISRYGKEGPQDNQWNGFLHDLKTSFHKDMCRFSDQILCATEQTTREIEIRHRETMEVLRSLGNRMGEFESELKAMKRDQADKMSLTIRENKSIALDFEGILEKRDDEEPLSPAAFADEMASEDAQWAGLVRRNTRHNTHVGQNRHDDLQRGQQPPIQEQVQVKVNVVSPSLNTLPVPGDANTNI